jgi:DNA invertase Pin-like site-specific DNA recombinase
MKIGYARVSTAGQHLDTQIEKLTTFGCEKIYEEKQSGKASDNSPVLQDALKFAREGIRSSLPALIGLPVPYWI